MATVSETHFRVVTNALKEGRLIPFLGAGVNRCGRPVNTSWHPDRREHLPDGRELAKHLRGDFKLSRSDVADLKRVAQYVSVMEGPVALYDRLHRVFDHDYCPNSLHNFLASLPALLQENNCGPLPLVVTTNYDDVLERAFREKRQAFDLVAYISDPEDGRGKFWHEAPGSERQVIESPNDYDRLRFGVRPTILKIHGTVKRGWENADHDSYVITEDHYIDYLAWTDPARLIPATIKAKFERGSFLFLGYGLRDWNLRVILSRVWREQRLGSNSWAIQLKPKDLDRRFWMKHGVEILDKSLEEYVGELEQHLLRFFHKDSISHAE